MEKNCLKMKGMNDLSLKSLYIDMPTWAPGIVTDDFIVAIGKKQSNSVYHVYASKPKPSPKPRMMRYHLKVLKSDLITAIKREESQKLIPVEWYSRTKKHKS